MNGTDLLRVTNQSLREAADRLVDERPDLPPGSVLRCFSRSVRAALLSGCPATRVAGEAERLTREMLAQRPGPVVRRHQPEGRRSLTRVPQPRRAS